MTTEEDFARGLRLLRTAAGLSQVELARRVADRGVKLDDLAVVRIENATHRPKPRQIRLNEAAAIAAVFDRSIEQVCHVGNEVAHSSDAEPATEGVVAADDFMKVAGARLRLLANEIEGFAR